MTDNEDQPDAILILSVDTDGEITLHKMSGKGPLNPVQSRAIGELLLDLADRQR